MLKLVNIKRHYSMGEQTVQALNGISLQVAQGEMLAIEGASGSGKSTLMNIMGLLDRPTEGEYYLDGLAVHQADVDQRAKLRNQYIGFIFQSFFLLPRLNVLQNIALPLFYRGLSNHLVHQRVLAILDRLDMADYRFHKPMQLSGGQQQRIAIARALIGEPRVILADEPTGSLDSVTSQSIMDLLKSIHCERNASIVIITHDAKISAQCQRTVAIRDGCLRNGH